MDTKRETALVEETALKLARQVADDQSVEVLGSKVIRQREGDIAESYDRQKRRGDS